MALIRQTQLGIAILTQHANTYDIIIIGGGMVGLTLACLLARHTPLNIAVLESKITNTHWDESYYQHRVSAIALASQRIFQSIRCWDALAAKRVSPFNRIEVWDGARQGELHFDCHEIGETQLGYIIENALIVDVLRTALLQLPRVDFIAPCQLSAVHYADQGITLMAQDGRVFKALLAVGADGARSWLREKCGITCHQHDYQQQAIVGTVTTEKAHAHIARQIFLPSGPLAFLPLSSPQLSSIVWSLPVTTAQEKLALNPEVFCEQLAEAFDHRLGRVLNVEARHAFPLVKQVASSYVAPRVALVGDAAHVVHPMAGQGVNMGLLDAACLYDVIVTAIAERRDFAAHSVLRRYERWRKADNLGLIAGVDFIKRIFANEQPSVQTLRSVGLHLTNEMRWIKTIFTRHATGDRSHLPRAARPGQHLV